MKKSHFDKRSDTACRNAPCARPTRRARSALSITLGPRCRFLSRLVTVFGDVLILGSSEKFVGKNVKQ